jgi:hypothetical protein
MSVLVGLYNYGISLIRTAQDSKDLEQLMNTPGVLAVHPVRFFPAPKYVFTSYASWQMPEHCNSPIQKDGIDDADKVAADLQSTHVVTVRLSEPLASRLDSSLTPRKRQHVDKLHEEGILGDGIKIGIIDTGTDCRPIAFIGVSPGH